MPRVHATKMLYFYLFIYLFIFLGWQRNSEATQWIQC